MQFGGIQKCSMIDYPGKISAVLFTVGCPFRCHFCHNASLVSPKKFPPLLNLEEVVSFLVRRKDQLDAVVISGGEPTLQEDLISFCQKLKKIGYLVKLDTMGFDPSVLKILLEQNLIDYVAMDLKAPLEKYASVVQTKPDVKRIKESITLLIQGNIPYEFRTTLVPSLHPLEDLESMAKEIQGAKLYILQKFVAKSTLTRSLKKEEAYTEKELQPYISKLLLYVQEVKMR